MLFNRNKKASKDFTEANLPKNRKEVFIDSFKIRYTTFFRLGGLLLIFAIPFFIMTIFKDLTLSGIYNDFQAGSMSQEDYAAQIKGIQIFSSLINIVCLVIFSLGLAGAVRVIRQIVWGEGVFFHQDFFDGIKMNGKMYFLLFFLIGIVNLLDQFVYYNFTGLSGFKALLGVLPMGISIFIFLPISNMIMGQACVYNVPFGKSIRNGFFLYVKTVPKTMLVTLIMLFPLLLNLINLIFIKYLLIAIFLIFFAPLFFMGLFLYDMSVFDRFINKETYPEIYDKGIYRQ